jgi:serine/threonine protein kinase
VTIDTGSLLGSYRVLAVLGQGGMGTVYLGEHIEIQRRAAVKVLRADLCDSPSALARFKAEAQAVNRIRHEHIVEVTDFGVVPGGEAYYVMEWLEGESLHQAIRRTGPLSLPRALHVAIQVADALAASHAAGIIHRDLKPGNVFLVSRGGDPDYVKLLDFGIAKLLKQSPGDGEVHTRTGVPLGTPHYMSPEQCKGQSVDARADIYSLGVMIYEMLTGQLPFTAENWMGILMAHVSTAFPKVGKLRTDVPAEIDELLGHCTAKKPDDRFADMPAVRGALAGLLGPAVLSSHTSPGLDPAQARAWERTLAPPPSSVLLAAPALPPPTGAAMVPPTAVPPPSVIGTAAPAPGAMGSGEPSGRHSTIPPQELMLELALEKEDAAQIAQLSARCVAIPLLVRAARYLRNLLAFGELVTVCNRILILEPRHVGALELCALALMKLHPSELEEPTRLLLEASRLAEEEGVPELSQATLLPAGMVTPGSLAPAAARSTHEGEALLGRLYKQIWRQAWDQGEGDVEGNRRRASASKGHLLKSVSNYERAQHRMEEAYPGINVATLYAVMGELVPPPLPESQRHRRVERILPLVKERLDRQLERAEMEKDRDRRDEALYWAHVSRAELLLATSAPGEEVMAELDEATTCVGSRKFLLHSTLDQLAMLRRLGFRPEVVAEAVAQLEAWL